ncbi:MAG: TetR/AcrR family transcriptional regulator [Ramlibacter sp.]|jgi:AcrR family transcriptional regulator|nr:TetR/AcrR family transcriptional regulator [Ramlibacter sp.]
MSSRKPPPKPYHHGNLHEALLDAADQLLAQHGAAGLTLREVARAAGVSHAAPYHHFAGLDELFAAVAERSFLQLGQALAQAAQASDAREALLGICEAYVAHAVAHPAQFRLMFGPMLARKAEYPDFAQAARAAFLQVLDASGRYAPGQAATVALAGWSLAHGFAHLAIDGALEGLPVPAAPDAAMARQLAQWLLVPR